MRKQEEEEKTSRVQAAPQQRLACIKKQRPAEPAERRFFCTVQVLRERRSVDKKKDFGHQQTLSATSKNCRCTRALYVGLVLKEHFGFRIFLTLTLGVLELTIWPSWCED